jgi:hypothetical protein
MATASAAIERCIVVAARVDAQRSATCVGEREDAGAIGHESARAVKVDHVRHDVRGCEGHVPAGASEVDALAERDVR